VALFDDDSDGGALVIKQRPCHVSRDDRRNGGLEAASGFEPENRGFADLRLNHLATPPLPARPSTIEEWICAIKPPGLTDVLEYG
jgi:hypothetical protein